jgi:hypothetical protein
LHEYGALKIDKEDALEVRLSHYHGMPISYDSHFIGWDKRDNGVRATHPGKLAITDCSMAWHKSSEYG